MSSTFNILKFSTDILEKIIFKPCINKECQVIFNKNISTVFNEYINYCNFRVNRFLKYKIIHYVGLIPLTKQIDILFNQALQKIKAENLYKEIINNVIKYLDIYSTPFYRIPERASYSLGIYHSITKRYVPKSIINIFKEIILELNNNIKDIYKVVEYYYQFETTFDIVYFSRIVCKYIINMNNDVKEKLKNNMIKHTIGKYKQDYAPPKCNRYLGEYWMGEYTDEIINNENNIFMYDMCHRFIHSNIDIDGNIDDDDILNIIENQEIMKSIIYKE
jgi:hypothetical protein